MAASPHYSELLRILKEFEVEYLIVGGYAVMKYTEPRFTKDLYVWVRNSAENAGRIYAALAKFGAPLTNDGITVDTFTKETAVYQIGVAPVRIDIATHIDGLTFDAAWPNRVEGTMFGEPAHFISRDDLIANKHASGRSVDSEDLKLIRQTDQE